MRVTPFALPIGSLTCHVVAEAGQCMEGSTARAIEMARVARRAGCWGFKVQLLSPEAIASTDALKYWHDDLGTETQVDAFRKAGVVPYSAWVDVKQACDQLGIVFFGTPFDLEAVDQLEAIDVPMYKIASGDITHRPLIERIARTKKPVMLSTGASSSRDILDALGWGLDEQNTVMLACSLVYPTPDGFANLARIETLRRYFPLVGYSDHTLGTRTSLAAATLGAVVLEKHYTMGGSRVPDHDIALTPDRMREYVIGAAHGVALRGDGELSVMAAEEAAHHGARRSIYAARDMARGHRLRLEDLAFLRPGGGTSPARYRELIDRELVDDVKAGERL